MAADTQTVEAPVVTPTPEPEPQSIAAHESAYAEGTPPAEPVVDDGQPLDDVVDDGTPQQRQRGSRAKSKMAAARINKLAGENLSLKQRLEALESKQKPEPVAPSVRFVPPVPAVEFNEPEPTIEQFADKDDPYGAWQRAVAKWDRAKERADEQAQHMQAQQQRVQQEASQQYQHTVLAHKQRLIAAIEANPKHLQLIQSVQVQLPPVLDVAVVGLDNQSVDAALFLASHPDELDDLVLKTAALPVTEETVAITRRLLRQRMTAGTTGSVAPSQPLPTAPRPPNPVRTGTIRTGIEPPAEGSSIADHAKFYTPKPR